MPVVRTEVAGNVWKVEVAVGQRVAAGDPLVIVESMKMEIPVQAPVDGTVTGIAVTKGDRVAEGAAVVTLG